MDDLNTDGEVWLWVNIDKGNSVWKVCNFYREHIKLEGLDRKQRQNKPRYWISLLKVQREHLEFEM